MTCLTIDMYLSRGVSSDAALFRQVLASLSRDAPPAPPEGFIRAPFGTTRIDLPGRRGFQLISFTSAAGYVSARTPGKFPSELANWLVQNIRGEKADVREADATQPLLDGTIVRARARTPSTDRRAAIVRLPLHAPVLFESQINAKSEQAPVPESGAPLDDAAWLTLVQAMAPLFERERPKPRAQD